MKKNIFAVIVLAMILATALPVFADSLISEREAMQIAMQHAGVEEADVTYIRVATFEDHEVREYDVKFYVGDQEYDYGIEAKTGQICSVRKNARHSAVSGHTTSEDIRNMNSVTGSDAFRVALARAGVH